MIPVRVLTRSRRFLACGFLLVAAMALLVASCSFATHPIVTQSDLDLGWPAISRWWQPKTSLPVNWREGKQLWTPPQRTSLRADVPTIDQATKVGLDAQCVLCHETYVTAFANNVHRKIGCESCHGPASYHLTSRGEGPASILALNADGSFTPSGKKLTATERSEICLQCHADDPKPLAQSWSTSAHAHQGVSCAGCHNAHYNVPPGTPPTVIGARPPSGRDGQVRTAEYLQGDESLAGTSRSLGAVSPNVCYRCHETMRRFEQPIHPHQIGAPIRVAGDAATAYWKNHEGSFNCTTCHNPHGSIRQETRKELCLECHDGSKMHEFHGSQHDLAEIGCTDCHNPHPETGASMTVNQPAVCYRCHSETRQLQEIAGPHQILGANEFNCTTCHQPHGGVTAETRTDLCLQCHTGSPTMAWHTSFHFRAGVACADCHNAHPDSRVPQLIGITHTRLNRPPRRAMSVNQPATCYKCHPKVYAESNMPSHHPIREGKLVCSDCHESHGQGHGSLKAETLNQLCFECHAEKQGPFVWEHAPVTESCAHCHAPHGAVANNLLHQPTTFLCLRCHTGHSTHGASPQCNRCHLINGNFTLVGGGPRDPTIPTTPTSRQALFTDCTQCHSQIHGSDFASGFECGHGFRK